MEKYINTLNQYYQKKFHTKVYKLALDIQGDCPNRDGTVGRGGCTFCLEGSGHFANVIEEDISEQIALAKEKLSKKTTDDSKYIAYFQSFTNTHGPIGRLKTACEAVLKDEQIIGISIATRPDCLGDEVLAFLSDLAEKTFLTVELGLQTIHDHTARSFNRCFPTKTFYDAVENLSKIPCEIVVHLIFGLPGESREEMMQSALKMNELPVHGVKLQVLHVLEGTALAKAYKKEPFPLLTQDEWNTFLIKLIPQLRENIVIHRLTGDGPKAYLIGPTWTANKRNVLNTMRKAFADANCRQGSRFGQQNAENSL